MDGIPSGALFGRYDFLLRRLQSLTGIMPVGAYLFVHLATNATVLDGTRSFQSRVDMIHSLGRFLPVVEWTFIFIPIIFHAVVGVLIMRTGHQNVGNYPYSGNVRYFLQRMTAWIALVFIFWHVFEMHGWIKPLAHRMGYGADFRHLYATSSAAAVLQQSPLIAGFYLIGVLACVYHFANGLWTAGITWGLWTTAAAQKRANYICGAFGLILLAIGLSAFFGMMLVDTQEAFQIETKINERKFANEEISEPELKDIPNFPQFRGPEEPEGPAHASREKSQDRS